MRLYLLPISTRRALIYCQRLNKQTSSKSSYADRITTKASETWSKWESHEKGWQKKVTEYGNKALERIPFQEWGLKSVPPLSARRKAEDIKGGTSIEVVFPGNVLKEEDIPAIVKRLGTERQSLHLRKAWWSLAATPLTLPFGLIPVVPNLPFFYLVYRSWSHFKALYGSKHLVFLVENNLLKPKSMAALEQVYSSSRSPLKFEISDTPSTVVEPHPDEQLLLDESSHSVLAKTVEVPELAAEIERAVRQVRHAIDLQKELSKEKTALEESAKSSNPEKSDSIKK